jgi:hypothetical protein
MFAPVAPPDTVKLLAQERRLTKPAGYLAVFGVLLFIISVFIQSSIGGDDLDTDAGLLRNYADDGSTLILSRVLFSLAFLSFIPALYVLFRAVQARMPSRIRPAMVAFCFIGPILLAVQAPVLAVGLKDAGEQFVEDESALASEADAGSADAETPDAGQTSTEPGGAAAGGDSAQQGGGGDEQQGVSGDEVTTTPTEEGDTTSGDEEEADPDDDPAEQRAEDLIEDNGTIGFARALLLPALVGMVGALVYIPLWAMRVGLLTRFMASFGMALGVSLIILPFAQLAVVFWFGVLGLVMLGRWIGGRPAAWDEGRAIPWQPRGQDPPQDPGPVEGSGRELGGDQAPESPRDDPGSDDQNGAGGSSPRKRKRRR